MLSGHRSSDSRHNWRDADAIRAGDEPSLLRVFLGWLEHRKVFGMINPLEPLGLIVLLVLFAALASN